MFTKRVLAMLSDCANLALGEVGRSQVLMNYTNNLI